MQSFHLVVRIFIYALWFSLTTAQVDSDVCNSHACVKTAAFISGALDLLTDPCDDFYQYACGNWIQEYSFGDPSKARYDWSRWSGLHREIMHKLIGLIGKQRLENSPKYLHPLLNFYNGCVNTTQRDLNTTIERDFEYIRSIVNSFGGWPSIDDEWNETNFDVEDALIELLTFIKSDNLVIDIEAVKDLRNNTNYMIGIGNPYYDADVIEAIYRPPRQRHEGNLFLAAEFAGEKNPLHIMIEALRGSVINETEFDEDLRKVLLLDEQLFGLSTNIDSNDVYNNWESYLTPFNSLEKFHGINMSKIVIGMLSKENITISDDDIIYIEDNNYVTNLGSVLQNQTKRTIANYIAMQLALKLVPHTSTSMAHMIAGKRLDSIPQQCMVIAMDDMGDIVTRLFIEKLFDIQSVSDMRSMFENLKQAFNQTLNENQWMDETTKDLALQKLNAIREYTAFPDYIIYDKQLEDRFSYYNNISEDNVLAFVVKSFNYKRRADTLQLKGQTLSRNHWPSRVKGVDINAFYYPKLNGIFIPAAFAELPNYNHDRPMSANFGAIGMVIGHEMTHAFDNSGSLFDDKGNLKDWITNSSKQNFIERSSCFVEQYSHFQYNVGGEQPLNLSGIKTLGENIADNGGIRIAYRVAMQKYNAENSGKLQRLPGLTANFTDEQIFFLSFANMWCSVITVDSLRKQINSDPHANKHARVVGALSNFDAFANAFQCPVNSTMNPSRKCTLW